MISVDGETVKVAENRDLLVIGAGAKDEFLELPG